LYPRDGQRANLLPKRMRGKSEGMHVPHDRQEPELPKLWPMSKGGKDLLSLL
jgi:hypothetical protein